MSTLPGRTFPAVTNFGYFQWFRGDGKPPIEGSALTVHNCRRTQGN